MRALRAEAQDRRDPPASDHASWLMGFSLVRSGLGFFWILLDFFE
jgi:hypothetical protein